MTTLADFDFEELKVIGRGQYGKAHLVKSGKDENTYVAKTIDLTCLSPKERQTSLQEVTLLRRLAHPNIVDYKDNFFMGDTLVIIMQYCECGDLASYIKDMSRRKMRLREVQIMKYFVQVLHALQYIHQERILHRDLKTSNLFLLKRRTLLKVGDFGISRVLEGSVQAAITVVGTPYYMPPEVCENKPYTYKSDVWALGCVLYELCQLKHAFCADNLLGLVYKIVSDKYEPIPRLYSQSLGTLVGHMLEKNADKRPRVDDLLADTYVQSFVTEYARTQQKPSGVPLGSTLPQQSRIGGGPPSLGHPAAQTVRSGARAWSRGQVEGEAAKDASGAGLGATAATRRSAAGAGGDAGPGTKVPGRGGGLRARPGRGSFRNASPCAGGAGASNAGAAGRGSGNKLELPREALLRRRREAAEKKGDDPKAGARQSSRSLAQKAKRVDSKPPEVKVLEPSPQGAAEQPLVVVPISPAHSSMEESTTFEESTPGPKPNEAWAVQDGSLSPDPYEADPRLEPATAFGEEPSGERTPERKEEPGPEAPDEVSDTMSSAEEYEDDFEEDYEGEDDFDKDYGSVAEEVDECSEIEDMEVGSVEIGNLPMVPEEEDYTRVLSSFEPDFGGRTRSTLISPPALRRVATDRISVGLHQPGLVMGSMPGVMLAAGLGSTVVVGGFRHGL